MAKYYDQPAPPEDVLKPGYIIILIMFVKMINDIVIIAGITLSLLQRIVYTPRTGMNQKCSGWEMLILMVMLAALLLLLVIIKRKEKKEGGRERKRKRIENKKKRLLMSLFRWQRICWKLFH